MASAAVLTASAALKSRVRRPSLLKKLAKPEDLMPLFPNGAYIGWSGFTGVGYPKKIPTMLADHVEKNGLEGKLKYTLFVGASSGAETENRWAALNMIERRSPHQVGKQIAKGINNGNIKFFDKHLSMFPVDLVYGFYTKDRPNKKLDVVIVEASAITEDGGIVPGASVGASPELIQMADKIIVEVNTAIPSMEGLHDITMTQLPPHRKPYLIMAPEDRIGTTSIPVDTEKIVAIVESDYQDQTVANAPADATSRAIANHLIEFLEYEVKHDRLPKNLLPLQSGIGNIANAVIGGLAESNFKNLKVWTEVLQDTFLDLFDSGRLDFATATSIRFSPEGFKRFYDGWEQYNNKLLLRSQQVSNSPEIIRRLGVIGMNTPVEVDIYAHANSTCVMGSRMLNGLGGSADFLRSSKYSIMHTPSTRPSKTDPHGVSCIVPMCTHVDQTEHDLDVIVTEQGLADVRGLSPKERAKVIIEKCAHPEYKPILEDYFKKAEFECMRRGWGIYQPSSTEEEPSHKSEFCQTASRRVPLEEDGRDIDRAIFIMDDDLPSKPRVRLPVMTTGVASLVAVQKLQDDLAKAELELGDLRYQYKEEKVAWFKKKQQMAETFKASRESLLTRCNEKIQEIKSRGKENILAQLTEQDARGLLESNQIMKETLAAATSDIKSQIQEDFESKARETSKSYGCRDFPSPCEPVQRRHPEKEIGRALAAASDWTDDETRDFIAKSPTARSIIMHNVRKQVLASLEKAKAEIKVKLEAEFEEKLKAAEEKTKVIESKQVMKGPQHHPMFGLGSANLSLNSMHNPASNLMTARPAFGQSAGSSWSGSFGPRASSVTKRTREIDDVSRDEHQQKKVCRDGGKPQ
ncbi:hypothetical protein EG329_012287 [Mollisiaceae sp. DMI_Dod_QoI]|nr:hypothetical protein EG329_012287 [Helotiales sp. DMI_Dod_QoI]